MWSSFLKSLPPESSINRVPKYRDLIDTYSQSLGFKQLDRVKIDCSFMPDSKWGFLGNHPGTPAWLLYLQLQFSQPSNCKLVNANVELVFERIAPSGVHPVRASNLGPIITDYFGPKGVTSVGNQRGSGGSIGQQSSIFIDADTLKVGASVDTYGSANHPEKSDANWSLRAFRWPITEGVDVGLYRRVEWIIEETSSPHQRILHRDQVRVGVILQHDSEPFSITVCIRGELQGPRSWFKFPRAIDTDTPGSNPSIRVSPSPGYEQTPLDDIAKRLDEDMTRLVFDGFRLGSNPGKRLRLDSEDIRHEWTKRPRVESHATIPSTPLQMVHTGRTLETYTIGWICALPLELAAATAMLDEVHSSLETPNQDSNDYILGNIGSHNIVVVCLPVGTYGTTSAASAVIQMIGTFPSLRFNLIVGIGGGVPNNGPDVRLGDIVVSKPSGRFPGVVQYDYGKRMANGEFKQNGTLNKPPRALLATIARMQSKSLMYTDQIVKHIDNIANTHPKMDDFYTRPPADRDYLFEPEYDHEESSNACTTCDADRRVRREPRTEGAPVVHYGIIASGNQVMKDSKARDEIAKVSGAICFEMEAAGVMDAFPSLVIRGISDYADSHKNDDWQKHAAAAAAAYAKELLSITPARQVEITRRRTAT